MHIKRWVGLLLAGTMLTGVALAMAIVYAYRYLAVPTTVDGAVAVATGQFLPRELRFVAVLLLGLGAVVFAFWKLSTSLLSPFMSLRAPGRDLATIVAEHRFGSDQPPFSVVAIGGGTGLPTLLRGLKQHDVAITAIVTVADDGGSTGRIRSDFDIPAPGDIRNCLVALADDEALVTRLFQHRFSTAGSELEGHSFGNLFITALTQVTGNFESAVIESASVLNIRGRVLPSTLENITLNAELEDGSVIHGESQIGHKQAPISRIYLDPEHPNGYSPAFSAIMEANLVVLGPGSLYTSVLPNLLVPDITQAIRWSLAPTVYVCNVATQSGETDDFTAADHVREIVNHLGPGVLDYALVNCNPASAEAIGPELQIAPVLATGLRDIDDRVAVVASDVVSDHNPLRHDPTKLAAALLDIAHGEFGDPRTLAATGGTPGGRGAALPAASGDKETVHGLSGRD